MITNCIMSTRWAAFRSVGAHAAGIRNVTVSNCVIRDTYGCGIKLQVSGNGSLENMTFSNIVMQNVSCPISLRFGNCHYNGEPLRPVVSVGLDAQYHVQQHLGDRSQRGNPKGSGEVP